MADVAIGGDLGDFGDRRGQRPERIAELERRVAALESTLVAQAAWMSDMQQSVAAGLQQMSGVQQGLESHAEWLTSLERWVSSCVKTLANFGAQPLDSDEPGTSGNIDIPGSFSARLEVSTVMDWIASAANVSDGPLVSVVTATRNRPDLLRAAIDSVRAQSYERFELVIVDDSDGEESHELVAAIHEPRTRMVRTAGRRGAGAAFNLGLETASGEIITALDDDNLMHPEWLRSVVWAFTTFPEVDALYGARTNEDPGGQHGVRSGMLPTLEFARYDRARHERANYIDRNTIAYRRSLQHIRYDESLPAALDWDHSLRLFNLAQPLALPALSCYYRTIVPNRVSDDPQQRESVRRVRARAFASRSLRVLVHSAMYPVLCETYIAEDIAALERAGAEVRVSALQEAVSQIEGTPTPRRDADVVIEEFRPDVVFMHWTTLAESQVPLMERYAQPFAVRVHSFDLDRERVRRLMAHPLCVAVFAHRHHLDALPDGVIPLMVTVGEETHIPEGRARRDLILSVSACLPKKNFAFLAGVFADLGEFERMLVLARTNGHEGLPREVEQLMKETDPSITVQVNLNRRMVLEEMARALVLIYTLEEGLPMGYPMSIVEAMLCGAIPVMPDLEAARVIVGPNARTFRDRADIVRHVREVSAGGEAIEQERQELIRLAQRHRHPEELVRLHDVLRDELTRWRRERV